MCDEISNPSGVTGSGVEEMTKTVKAVALSQTEAQSSADLMGIAGAVVLGLILLFAAGFAQASIVHDTAHDTRHAMSFPCH